MAMAIPPFNDEESLQVLTAAVEATAEPKKEGKIRCLGLSECSARMLTRASKVHPIVATEVEFSPFALEIKSSQTNFLKTARELGIKIVAYARLGKGFLNGTTRAEMISVRRMRGCFLASQWTTLGGV